MAVKFKKLIMDESEFEKFCKMRFQDAGFLLGRKTKEDPLEGVKGHMIGGDKTNQDLTNVKDVSELLTESKHETYDYGEGKQTPNKFGKFTPK
jgi:hypothetical protein